MTKSPPRVLFLDGIGCNPDGFKPRFLTDQGYRVIAPMLPDLDFIEAVEVANRAVTDSSPDVIVGYSRGASVAMMLTDCRSPRLLIAPALQWAADNCATTAETLVIHSATDDSLPLESVKTELKRCGIDLAKLQITGDDHTMIDQAALNAMTTGLEKLLSSF